MRRKIIAVVLALTIAAAFMPLISYATDKDISSGFTVLFVNDNDSFSYTGSKITPAFIVIESGAIWDEYTGDYEKSYYYYTEHYKDDDSLVSESKYSVSYLTDQISVGTQTFKITGKSGSGLTGSFTADYYISPKEIKFKASKNADKSVDLTPSETIDLTGAKVELWTDDMVLTPDKDYTISGNTVTILPAFLNTLKSLWLKHKVRISTDNYFGMVTVKSYNISGLAGYGNIKKVYNGKQKSLTDSDLGITDAKLGTEYKIVYAKKTRKAIGKYNYTLKGKGDYVGQLKGSFKIVPKTTSKIKYAKRTKSKAVIKWKKVANCSGYQVQLVRLGYDDSDEPINVVYKTAIVKGKSKLSKTFKHVKKSKYSKVRVRTYKTVKGVKYWSGWKYKRF